jgi:two-component system OmpR family sensor kinase
MASQEARDLAGRWLGRPFRALRAFSDRTSLRAKLIVALLALAAVALAAISISSVWLLRSYVTSQDDSTLRSAYESVSLQMAAGGVNIPPGTYELSPSRGLDILVGVAKPGTPLSTPESQYGFPYGPSQQVTSLPAVSTNLAWASANDGNFVTVPAVSGPDTWRVIVEPVTYQAATASGGTQQVDGTLVVGVDLGDISTTVNRLAAADLIVGAIIVCVLTLAIVVVVQSNLRPLVEIEETAGEIAEGHLNRRVPERDPRTEIGSLGRSLNMMLSQIETAFHAREESEAAAHQSEERMRRFIADASHELRTPLTAIRGFAEYYRQRGGLASPQGDGDPAAAATGLTPQDLDRIMQRVEKEAARMGLLVEDLLLLARLDQQRPLAHQPVDLLSVAGDAVSDARMLAPGRDITLQVQPGAAFLIVGDEPRLRQVIGNLMNNALTHTPDHTPIEVVIRPGALDPRVPDSPPAVIVEVTDHGPGMTKEQASRVFERFYRADQARNRATGGTGLGLAIVNALVAAHGGVTSVHTAPGKGATFSVALPLAAEAQGAGMADDEEDGPAEHGESFGPADQIESGGRF